MRITKEPEARKQEILDTALKLFGENGYEKTSITDIAKAIGVAQGLCYRYFPSKEALFDDQLSLKVCEKLVPPVEKLLQRAQQNGEIQIDDLQAAAMFCVYGQLGILLADELTQEDKSKRIREFLIYALRL